MGGLQGSPQGFNPLECKEMIAGSRDGWGCSAPSGIKPPSAASQPLCKPHVSLLS